MQDAMLFPSLKNSTSCGMSPPIKSKNKTFLCLVFPPNSLPGKEIMEKSGFHFFRLSLKNIVINQGKTQLPARSICCQHAIQEEIYSQFWRSQSKLKNENKCKQWLNKVSNKLTRLTKLRKWATNRNGISSLDSYGFKIFKKMFLETVINSDLLCS